MTTPDPNPTPGSNRPNTGQGPASWAEPINPEPGTTTAGPLGAPHHEPVPPAEGLADLTASFRSLRALFQIALVALILALAVLNVFFLLQVRNLRVQAYELQVTAVKMLEVVGDYETNSVPLIQRLSNELHQFADRTPDFAPVMARYPIVTNRPRAATNAPAPAPAPAAPKPAGR